MAQSGSTTKTGARVSGESMVTSEEKKREGETLAYGNILDDCD